ncbi:MAG: ATP-binding protein [Gemmatimonadota bacterium]
MTIPLLALLILIVGGGVFARVRYINGEMMRTWERVLEGGAVTTRATVDDWYLERSADVEALAATVAIHAAAPESGGAPHSTLLAPIKRRGKFAGVWMVDQAGDTLASSHGDSLLSAERELVREVMRTGRTLHSPVIPLGPHAAFLSIAAPVHLRDPINGKQWPKAVVFRVDVVAAFAPWAVGRANAALSLFSTPGRDGPVIISVCPEQTPSVCITQAGPTPVNSPAVLSLTKKEAFGVFPIPDGTRVLAVTRYDSLLGWGIIRRVRESDALVPRNKELAIEGAFLAVFIALSAVGGYAVNRTIRVRRLYQQREETKRLATIVDASTDGIISLDKDFRVTMVNGAVERMLGFRGDSLVGKPVFELFDERSRDALVKTLETFSRSELAQAPLTDAERCLAQCADGSTLPTDVRLSRAFFDGVPIYVVGLRDVTERARADLFLQGQRHVLELIASGAPAADTLAVLLAMVSEQALLLRCAVYELDGERQVAHIVASHRLPTGFLTAAHYVPVGLAAGVVGIAIQRGESVFCADVREDPASRDTSALLVSYGLLGAFAIPLRAANGEIIGALAAYCEQARDASTQEAEIARTAVHLASIALSSARDASSLRASEASFRSFVENAPAAIFRETHRGVLVSANPAMVTLLGYPSAQELTHAADRDRLYHDGAARSELLRLLEAEGVVRGLEVEWCRADRSLVTVRLSARAYRDEKDKVWLWEGYAEDVTSLRAAESALRRSERLAAVGQLISGVAHELNNPLSSIMHFAEDLLADERSTEDAEALGVIRDQARRSRAIVRDLLSFVRQRSASASPLLIAEVVASTARAMRPALENEGVTLEIAQGAEGAFVLADRSGIEQIVANLVSNAAQAAGRGGQVWVHTDSSSDGCVLVVEDNGPGVPADILPRIFDPFFTTKPTGEGTGLGLSVTLGIVEQLGGRIAVESRDGGQGSRFTVTLPCIDPGPMIPDSPDHDSSPRVTPESVGAIATGDVAPAPPRERIALIIDDEPTIRTALRRFFTRRGWAVEEAEDGGAGLDILERLGDAVTVVISDLRMPGFSGIDLHDRLAETQPAVLKRFIFSTGDVASAEAASFVLRTSCPVLQKPFELRMLDEILTQLANRTAERSLP